MKKVLSYLFAALLLTSAVAHVTSPEFYAPMIPEFISESFANIMSTITEFVVALLLIIPKYRKWGGLGFMILMLAFLPIHTWDLFRENPAVGEPPAPVIRFVFQFVLIYAGWWIYKKHDQT